VVAVCRGYGAERIDAGNGEVEAQLGFEIFELEETDPFGRCVTHAIDAPPAEAVLAVIEEHDFYGPGNLEDAVRSALQSPRSYQGRGLHLSRSHVVNPSLPDQR